MLRLLSRQVRAVNQQGAKERRYAERAGHKEGAERVRVVCEGELFQSEEAQCAAR